VCRPNVTAFCRRVRRLGDSSGQGLEKVKELLAEFEQMRAMMQSMAKKLPGSTDAGAETGVECEQTHPQWFICGFQ
jgi:signal recognition particle GTPase